MIYLSGVRTEALIPPLDAGLLGMVNTPAVSYRLNPAWTWGADNGCFAASYPGDDKYLRWLGRQHAPTALFAVAPDVPFDMTGTLQRSAPMLSRIRGAGYPVALAVQNGAEAMPLPWDEIDCVFLGGDTEWKTSRHAQQVAFDAKRRGKWVHMGRVNSQKRLKRAAELGADSADGTFLAFGPAVNLPKMLSWIAHVDAHPVLPLPGEATA